MSKKAFDHPVATNSSGLTWSISDVERETGLGKDTLRVWERRYGFPAPLRDALGERAYPDDQLNRLRMIRRLLDADHRPGKVVSLPLEALQDLLSVQNARDPHPQIKRKVQTRPKTNSVIEPDSFSKDNEDVWVGWLKRDETHQIKQALQQNILMHGLGYVVENLAAPLCRLVGQAWMSGDISVYQEHLFTETLQSVLREAIASIDAVVQTRGCRPRVLLTTTPNELHSLGLLMVECHFALAACERFVLGTSTPISDIIQAVERLNIDVLAISYSPYASRKEVLDSLQQLRTHINDAVDIWVGGAGAYANRRLLPEGVALMRKASDVSDQVAAWRSRHGRQ